jgi:cytochrome c biogenesis protein CcmG/thiol:disulfide interchange protein DsbE
LYNKKNNGRIKLKNIYNIAVFILCIIFAGTADSSAPNFTLNTLKGSGSVSLSSLRGKVVLLDFWASWCEPCKLSFPAYNKLLQQYGGQGFTIVGINQDRDLGEALKFLDQFPARFTILSDPDSVATNLYNPPTMPTSYLIDRQGNIVKTYEGYHQGDEEQIAQDIANYLAAKTQASSKGMKAEAATPPTTETEEE